MHILLINPNSTVSMTEQVRDSARRCAFPGTRIEALNQAMTGPEAAHWLPLLKANNLAQAWSHCQPLPQPNGGKACSFALWTEQPPAQR